MANKVGIVGASGYTGEELLRILARHDTAEVVFATSERSSGVAVTDILPSLPMYKNLELRSVADVVNQPCDVVFMCLPAGESANLAVEFLSRGTKIIDLGADFRFDDPDEYEKWYHIKHPAPDLLAQAEYGLPEWNRAAIGGAQIVGNPGCYPTSALLAVLPFLQRGLVKAQPIVVDSKSGISGAGKSPSQTTHFVETNENLSPYKAGRVHRHVGEMEREMDKQSHSPVTVFFTPHLVPINRGLFSCIYVHLTKKMNRQGLLTVLNEAYEKEHFIQVVSNGYPAINMATHSNNCYLGAEVADDSDVAVIFSAIDNLGKGASGQAVQNMNIMLELPETMGL